MYTTQSPWDLSGKVALITGGAGFLGFAMAEALAQAGASVVVASRDAARATAAAGKIPGGRGHGVDFDPNDTNSIRAAFDKIESEVGPLTTLINAAGGNIPGATVQPGTSFTALSQSALEEVWKSNVLAGAVLPTQVFIDRITEKPRDASIMMIGSVSSDHALTRVVGYGMAKAAVENLTRWLAVHVARDLKIPLRVNAIVPGFFLTEQNRYLLQTKEGGLTERGEAITRLTPMGRLGAPEELGGAAVWLASDSSKFVTGACIPVDGGFTAWSGV
ncbi:MAG: SDR family oxidoreductase [Candidatus Sumerlaeota bacterium]